MGKIKLSFTTKQALDRLALYPSLKVGCNRISFVTNPKEWGTYKYVQIDKKILRAIDYRTRWNTEDQIEEIKREVNR
jgi:hypothetical protein